MHTPPDAQQTHPSHSRFRRRDVLFLCTANSARSQMAEAFLRRLVGDRLRVLSAGLKPQPIHPMTLRVMDEIGIDISGQTSKSIDDLKDIESILFVIILCGEAERGCPATFARAAVRLSWPFDDPAEPCPDERTQVARFRRIRDQIRRRVETWAYEDLPAGWSA